MLLVFCAEWPPELLELIIYIKGLAKLDLMSMDGLACLGNEVTFESKVVTYTAIPPIIAFMIWVPLLTARVRGYHAQEHDENHRDVTVTDRFWTNLMFMLFLLCEFAGVSMCACFLCTDCDPHEQQSSARTSHAANTRR